MYLESELLVFENKSHTFQKDSSFDQKNLF